MAVDDSQREVLLLSIHPSYSQAILAGEKTVELRRQRPRVGPGSICVVYETSPTMALVGAFAIEELVEDAPTVLWKRFQSAVCVRSERFFQYYAGRERAIGIRIRRVWAFRDPVHLTQLRQLWPSFQPPQGFRYLRTDELGELSLELSGRGVLRLST